MDKILAFPAKTLKFGTHWDMEEIFLLGNVLQNQNFLNVLTPPVAWLLLPVFLSLSLSYHYELINLSHGCFYLRNGFPYLTKQAEV
jgi:hypothetical protein